MFQSYTTGAPVPPGADAVVKVEDTQPAAAAAAEGEAGSSQQRRVVICKEVPAGKDIRAVGSDIQ
jgi:molybdopterin biosynthesis enzyme